MFLFRPFLEVAPYAGYCLGYNAGSDAAASTLSDYLNRLEYGVGVGGGIEIWKIQVSARYVWDVSSFSKIMENSKTGGVMISAALFF